MFISSLPSSPLRHNGCPCVPFRNYFSKKWLVDYAYNNPERLDEILEYDCCGALSTQDVNFLREYAR